MTDLTAFSQPDLSPADLPAGDDDPIPPPAPALPPGSRLLFAPNPLFVGRQADLRALARRLKSGRIAAVTGMGGLGKSQLAVEFAYRYAAYFPGGVFWLSLANLDIARLDAAACGGPDHLNLAPNFESLPLAERIRLVWTAWQQPIPRLLIFDNCEDEALLAQWRPPAGGGRILLTGRRAAWDPALGVRVIPLGLLRPAESLALLQQFLEPTTTADVPTFERSNVETLADIAAELGHLPLALHLAGSFLRRYGHTVSPAAYLAQLRQKGRLAHLSLQGHGLAFSPTGHELHVARTFALSYDKLLRPSTTDRRLLTADHQPPQTSDLSASTFDPVSDIALQLLARAAHLAPGEAIPRPLLLATLELPEEDDAADLLAADSLNRLAELGLLEAAPDGRLTLHRLLADFTRQAGDTATAQAAVEAALLAEARRLNAAGYPAPLLAWQAHLRYVTDAAFDREDKLAASLCNELGYHLQVTGDYEAARPYYEWALAIFTAWLGVDHPYTKIVQGNLAGLRQK